MKKILSVLIAAALMIVALAACGGNGNNAASSDAGSEVSSAASAEKATVNIATLAGPTGMGMAYMLKGSDDGTTRNTYKYDICSSPDEITSKIVSGEYDIAALPTNAAATLYNKTGGKVKMLALNTLGVLYLLEKGDTVKDVADLKGKTIYVSGQGSTPEYVLNYILESNGLKVGTDVTLDFTYSTHNDLVAFAATGAADLVLLPEPTVTALMTKNADMRVAFDLNDLWADCVKDSDNADSVISMGCAVVNTAFAESNPQAVKDFLDDYSESAGKVNDDYTAASEVIAELGIVQAPAVALKALDRCNIVCITGNDMKKTVNNFFEVLYNANASSVGGSMPDDQIYYIG